MDTPRNLNTLADALTNPLDYGFEKSPDSTGLLVWTSPTGSLRLSPSESTQFLEEVVKARKEQDAWTEADAESAEKDGWELWPHCDGLMIVSRGDRFPTLTSTALHVVDQAAKGDKLAQKALRLVRESLQTRSEQCPR